jgi:hypothetical protein
MNGIDNNLSSLVHGGESTQRRGELSKGERTWRVERGELSKGKRTGRVERGELSKGERTR